MGSQTPFSAAVNFMLRIQWEEEFCNLLLYTGLHLRSIIPGSFNEPKKERNMKTKISISITITAILLGTFLTTVCADIAPPLQPPGANPAPLEYEQTHVEMWYETVEIYVEEQAGSSESTANTAHNPKISGDMCPECGNMLVFEEGCSKCRNCGYSRC